MKRITKQQITDLYCDLAAHLLSITEVQQIGPEVVTWLSERVMFGLPNAIAYTRRPTSELNIPRSHITDILSDFCYPDSDNNLATTFLQYMLRAADGLVDLNLPRFARHTELAILHSETGAPR